MGIEEILEIEKFQEGFWSRLFFESRITHKIKLRVHCSCGQDYKVKKTIKRDVDTTHDCIRPTECTRCSQRTYIQYRISYGDDGDYPIQVRRAK